MLAKKACNLLMSQIEVAEVCEKKPMITELQEKTKNTFTAINQPFFLKNLSMQDLINHAIENDFNQGTESSYKQELIDRGKDDIYTRIEIKKSCKVKIAEQEALIQEFERRKIHDKKTAHSLKGKLLSTISILDRLQLEWYRHDLKIKK